MKWLIDSTKSTLKESITILNNIYNNDKKKINKFFEYYDTFIYQ
jgi:hypothetical protein